LLLYQNVYLLNFDCFKQKINFKSSNLSVNSCQVKILYMAIQFFKLTRYTKKKKASITSRRAKYNINNNIEVKQILLLNESRKYLQLDFLDFPSILQPFCLMFHQWPLKTLTVPRTKNDIFFFSPYYLSNTYISFINLHKSFFSNNRRKKK
jgi:hypothetical protein